MNGWRAFLTGWRCRTRHPDFRKGDRIVAYVTGYDPDSGEALVRVGDSVLRVPGLSAGRVDRRISLEVIDFDPETHAGEARPREEG